VIVATGGAQLRPEDGVEQWRPISRRLVTEEGFPAGYAADDAAALVFEGTSSAEAVTTVEESTTYRVDADGEEPLAARRLRPTAAG
jgi:hypothetical protein